MPPVVSPTLQQNLTSHPELQRAVSTVLRAHYERTFSSDDITANEVPNQQHRPHPPLTATTSLLVKMNSSVPVAVPVDNNMAAAFQLGLHKRLDRTQSEPVWQQQSQDLRQATTNSSRYKTELCRPFEENGFCKYGDKCQFAHGGAELRTLSRHPKYKTELCRTFHTIGICPYGPRCHFIHNAEESRVHSPQMAGGPIHPALLAGGPNMSSLAGLYDTTTPPCSHTPTSPGVFFDESPLSPTGANNDMHNILLESLADSIANSLRLSNKMTHMNIQGSLATQLANQIHNNSAYNLPSFRSNTPPIMGSMDTPPASPPDSSHCSPASSVIGESGNSNMRLPVFQNINSALQ